MSTAHRSEDDTWHTTTQIGQPGQTFESIKIRTVSVQVVSLCAVSVKSVSVWIVSVKAVSVRTVSKCRDTNLHSLVHNSSKFPAQAGTCGCTRWWPH